MSRCFVRTTAGSGRGRLAIRFNLDPQKWFDLTIPTTHGPSRLVDEGLPNLLGEQQLGMWIHQSDPLDLSKRTSLIPTARWAHSASGGRDPAPRRVPKVAAAVAAGDGGGGDGTGPRKGGSDGTVTLCRYPSNFGWL